eukprot:COSAG01_NODE_906_length_12834_cov_53.626620_3_plen_47_part_00
MEHQQEEMKMRMASQLGLEALGLAVRPSACGRATNHDCHLHMSETR